MTRSLLPFLVLFWCFTATAADYKYPPFVSVYREALSGDPQQALIRLRAVFMESSRSRDFSSITVKEGRTEYDRQIERAKMAANEAKEDGENLRKILEAQKRFDTEPESMHLYFPVGMVRGEFEGRSVWLVSYVWEIAVPMKHENPVTKKSELEPPDDLELGHARDILYDATTFDILLSTQCD